MIKCQKPAELNSVKRNLWRSVFPGFDKDLIKDLSSANPGEPVYVESCAQIYKAIKQQIDDLKDTFSSELESQKSVLME